MRQRLGPFWAGSGPHTLLWRLLSSCLVAVWWALGLLAGCAVQEQRSFLLADIDVRSGIAFAASTRGFANGCASPRALSWPAHRQCAGLGVGGTNWIWQRGSTWHSYQQRHIASEPVWVHLMLLDV